MNVFHEAEQAVYQYGWWHGPDYELAADPAEDETVGVSGAVCIATAVTRAACLSQRDAALDRLKDVLGLPHSPGTLADWNDAPERTVFDILRALRLAAESQG